MSNTPNLALPEIAENQRSKYLTHNEALQLIDVLVQARVVDKDLTSPPAHTDGNLYIVAASATGDWNGQDGNLAASINSSWEFVTPETDFLVFVQDENLWYRYNGTNWVQDPYTVTGPASSTDNAIARYDGTSGGSIQDSGWTIDDSDNIQRSGNTVIDNARVGTFTQANVDNVRIDGNTISTTDTNGDLDLAPDGTGQVTINGSTAGVDTILDEDTMASDSATALATQQSIKAYVDANAGGSGDVTGPASSTDNAIVRFDGTGGKTIQNSGWTIDDSNNVKLSGTTVINSSREGFFALRGCRVYLSANQSIPDSTSTKVQFDSETFDTNNEFDSTTNYRYTPTEAGYYQVSVSLDLIKTGTSSGFFEVNILKNGATYETGFMHDTGNDVSKMLTDIVEMNGTTDYIEIYVMQDTGVSKDLLAGTARSRLTIQKVGT